MINLQKINTSILSNDEKVTVAIIDAGFKNVPSYAKVIGNNNLHYKHGNRVLSIFTALDEKYPLPNLTLYLLPYNPQQGYEGLKKALKSINKVDILSISMLWKDDNKEIKDLLFEKANKICVPILKHYSIPYPSVYNGVINCSLQVNNRADYCIKSTLNWQGNSYAVPAIARLLAYNKELINDKNGQKVQVLFNNNYESKNINLISKIIKCKYCKKELFAKNHTRLKETPDFCPYCGFKLK